MVHTEDRKEVAEAVLIAALGALVTGLIDFGFSLLRKRAGLDEDESEEEDES